MGKIVRSGGESRAAAARHGSGRAQVHRGRRQIDYGDILWLVSRCQRGRRCSSRFHGDLHGSGTSMSVYHFFAACVHFIRFSFG